MSHGQTGEQVKLPIECCYICQPARVSLVRVWVHSTCAVLRVVGGQRKRESVGSFRGGEAKILANPGSPRPPRRRCGFVKGGSSAEGAARHARARAAGGPRGPPPLVVVVPAGWVAKRSLLALEGASLAPQKKAARQDFAEQRGAEAATRNTHTHTTEAQPPAHAHARATPLKKTKPRR